MKMLGRRIEVANKIEDISIRVIFGFILYHELCSLLDIYTFVFLSSASVEYERVTANFHENGVCLFRNL